MKRSASCSSVNCHQLCTWLSVSILPQPTLTMIFSRAYNRSYEIYQMLPLRYLIKGSIISFMRNFKCMTLIYLQIILSRTFCLSFVETGLTCNHNAVVRQDGESWQVDACTTCACKDGLTFCKAASCKEPVHCSWMGVPKGECCPVCKGDYFDYIV